MSDTAERQALWGGETAKAVDNFPVSGEPIPTAVAHWLGRIKAAAARANADLGLLEPELAKRIADAGDRIAAGEFDDQFPIDVFQTGSGTSSNMNANEVIASLAGEGVHANDHVNMGQSSNDVFPSAVHLAALDRSVHDLLPALEQLAHALEGKAREFDDVVKSGRTHLMDAVPVTLGQEFAGYAAQVRQGIARVQDALPRVGQIPLGGELVLSLGRLTAIGPVDPLAAQVTAGAGATLEAVERAAAAAGLSLGIDFGARGTATIGGMTATDAGGAQVLRHGTMRARVAGLEAVLADGSVLSRLSGLEKDNAGYDLPQLLVGSEGTLAVVTAARLRLVPAPRRIVAALLALPDTRAAVALTGRLRRRLPSLRAAELLYQDGLELVCAHRRLAPPFPAPHPVYVLVECGADGDPIDDLAAALDGDEAVLDVAVAEDAERRAALWTYREAHNEAVSAAGVPHKLDVTLPAGAIAPFVDAVRAAVPGARTILWGHLGDGNLHVNLLGPDPEDHGPDEAVLRLVAAHGGSISAEHGIGQAKRDWLGLTRSPQEIRAMVAVKAALDPSGTLNPGKVLSPGSAPRR